MDLLLVLLITLNFAIYEDQVGFNKGPEVEVCVSEDGILPCLDEVEEQ